VTAMLARPPKIQGMVMDGAMAPGMGPSGAPKVAIKEPGLAAGAAMLILTTVIDKHGGFR
jgi:hypothetical protein